MTASDFSIHIPAPGKANGLQGTAVCGRHARYSTGDHELIRRLARRAINEGQAEHYCQVCLRAVAQ